MVPCLFFEFSKKPLHVYSIFIKKITVAKGSSLQAAEIKKLEKDNIDSIAPKTVLLLKKSPFAEEVYQQLRPQGSTPRRLYGLQKVHKPGVPLRPIVNTIGSPNYRLAQHLAGLLSCYMAHSSHHIKNSVEFVHALHSL
jgi:hypothetical protein